MSNFRFNAYFVNSTNRPFGEVSCDFPAQGWERLPHLLPDPVSEETRTFRWASI